MLDPVVTAVKAIQAKQAEAKPSFTYKEGIDGYTRGVDVMDGKGYRIAHLQQSVGHCCAASVLGSLSSYGFWNSKPKVNAFLKELKSAWEQQRHVRNAEGVSLTVFPISGFYVYLSCETSDYDVALRTHPKIKLVHEFRNKRNGPSAGDNGHLISLYFMEF